MFGYLKFYTHLNPLVTVTVLRLVKVATAFIGNMVGKLQCGRGRGI